jgi:hypothetical protein
VASPNIRRPNRRAGVAPAQRLANPEASLSHVVASSPDPLRPIFLHGLWRSGSTYVWSRFRATDGVVCYYEPLHDGLARLTRDRIHRDTPEAVQTNHHPALAQPYFTEFAPLVEGRGVRNYQRRFAYTHFAPATDEDDPALQAYVQGLIDHAWSQGRAPVFGFNRTGLRIAWLRARFEACNIHIDRDPIDVFSSYLGQLQAGNYYYFVKWMQIIAGNADHPLFASALPLFRQPSRAEALYVNPKHFYRRVIDEASLETLYSITFLAWAVCAVHALEHSDLVIDTAMTDRSGYGEAVAAEVRQHCGLSVDFADMQAPTAPSPLRLAHQRLIERAILGWFNAPAAKNLFDHAKIRARLGELSLRRADLLARVV